MAKFPWLNRFPVDTAGHSDSLTALKNFIATGLISEGEYLTWASLHYKLPKVSSDFFTKKLDSTLIKKYENNNWNESYYPIYEWQDVVYVACLEPKNINIGKHVCHVIASMKTMKEHWPQVNSLEQTTTKTSTQVAAAVDTKDVSEKIVEETLDAIPTDHPETNIVPDLNINSIVTENENNSKPNLEFNTSEGIKKTSTPSLELSNDFSQQDEAGAFDLDFSSLKTSAPQQTPETSVEKTIDPPPPEKTVEAPTQSEQATVITAPEIKIQKEESSVNTKTELTPTNSQVNMNPNFNKDNYDIPEITQVVNVPKPSLGKNSGTVSDDISFTTTKTIMPFPERTTQFTFMRTVYSQQLILEAPQQVKDSKDPHEALMSAFRILKDYFSKLMWVVRDNKGRVYPIACDSNWEFTEEAWLTPLDFKSKNPFRLAKYTQKPFHGPIPKNTASDAYFKLWHNNEYPDHLSIVPVKLHGKVFGYFIGCGKGDHFHQQHSLEIMQSVCNDLVTTFINMHRELDNAA